MQIEALLAAKSQRTPTQRKVSSQLLEAQRTPPPRRTVNPRLLDDQRTPAQKKLNSQLKEALRAPLQKPTSEKSSRLQATDTDATSEGEAADAEANNDRVMVDIRAEVTPAVLTRIRDLGGTVISSVPKYRAIRALIPLRAVEMLAAQDAIRMIRPADQARTRAQASTRPPRPPDTKSGFPGGPQKITPPQAPSPIGRTRPAEPIASMAPASGSV